MIKTSAALVGKQGSDDVALVTTNATATFATKDIGTTKPITIAGITISGTDMGNYTLTQPATSATITAKELTVTGITAANRTYDATTYATELLVKTSATLIGKQGSDDVALITTNAAGTFATKDIGTTKPITIEGITISGTDMGNYTLTQPATSATITAKELTVTGITAATKIFDGNAMATVDATNAQLVGKISGDDTDLVKTSVAGAFADSAVAAAKTVTISGLTLFGTDATNYSLTQPSTNADIITASASVAWSTPSSIIYGNTLTVLQLNATANIPGSFAYAPAAGAQLNVGTHTLSVTFTPTNTSYDPATANVSISVIAKQLTVTGITAVGRVYDNTRTATNLLNKNNAAVSGVVSDGLVCGCQYRQ